MTKRLTPEEDAQLIRCLDRGASRGRLVTNGGGRGDDDIHICIDKDAQQMEITREGKRFLEVRFKRRESMDAGSAYAESLVDGEWTDRREGLDAGEIVAVDEIVPWPTDEEIARVRASLPDEHRYRLAGLRDNAFVVRANRMGYFKRPCQCAACEQARRRG